MASTPQKPRSRSPAHSTQHKEHDGGHRHKRARTAEKDNIEELVQNSTAALSSVDAYRNALKKSQTSGTPNPNEQPPLPSQPLPGAQEQKEEEEDDGWAPVWEQSVQAYYFYNQFTGASQWTNPRVPEPPEVARAIPPAPGTESSTSAAASSSLEPPPPTSEALPAGGYNPAIHGDYDPNAWYAQTAAPEETQLQNPTNPSDPTAQYGATAAFNRFTGRFQNSEITPENYNDENKSKRQMNAFFDVDAAANSHDGKSLKAERSGKKLTKTELKNFKEKRKAKKEEKRRAWLKD